MNKLKEHLTDEDIRGILEESSIELHLHYIEAVLIWVSNKSFSIEAIVFQDIPSINPILIPDSILLYT